MNANSATLCEPDGIWECYVRMGEALREVSLPSPVAGMGPPAQTMTWASLMTPEELRERLRNELDLEVALTLIASYEGRVREDYRVRMKSKSADAVSRLFRKKGWRPSKWIRIEEMLEVWKRGIDSKRMRRAVGLFKHVLNTRDWLAHGRVGHLRVAAACTPEEARMAGESLMAEISA